MPQDSSKISNKTNATRRFTITCLISLIFISFLLSLSAKAHEIRPAIVDFVFNKNGLYQLTIQHNIEALIAEISSEHDDTEESGNAIKYNNLRNLPAEALNAEFEKFSPEFLNGLQLSFDNKAEPLQILDVEIPEVGDTELARDSIINIAGIIPKDINNMSWKWDKKFGNAVLRVSSESNPELFSSYLENGDESEEVPLNIACYDPENSQKVGGCAEGQTKSDDKPWYRNVIMILVAIIIALIALYWGLKRNKKKRHPPTF